jgi:hypothetical protein
MYLILGVPTEKYRVSRPAAAGQITVLQLLEHDIGKD